MKLKHYSALPGFGISLGFTLFYLSLIVLIPLSTIFFKAFGLGWEHFWQAVTSARTLAALRLSFSTSLVSALINACFGLLVAWVLVRYEFPGKKLVDAFVDFPFALPTAVAGIALTALYSQNGWVGKQLYAMGIKSAFSPFGITIALVFIGLPFVVRTVEPVLQNLESEVEEAASSLGANRWQIFLKIILPTIAPALMTGSAMAFSRALGEYGSVVFIAGNMPMKTEIAPLLIMTKLEQYDYAGATAIAGVMLIVSFIMLLVLNILQAWSRQSESL
ncbi:MAG: sulfate ABC transporter permease subunit CysT [Candidatus Omnitrophota bacterium]